MSAKRRKSSGQIWYICDICKSILLVKDTSIHKENCCIDEGNTLIYPYLKNEILFTKIEVLGVEGNPFLKNIPNDRQNEFIFVSMGALQLLKIPIGDIILISSKGGNLFIPFVKRVWPSGEKNLSTYLTKQAMVLNSVTPSTSISIQSIKNKLKFAKEVTIQCETEFEVINEIEFLGYLKEQNLGNIYCNGNKFTYNHYGKFLRFKIGDVKSLDYDSIDYNACVLEKGTNFQPEFFVITKETTFKIYGKDVCNPQSKCSHKKIGGLDDTIQELEELILLSLYGNPALSNFHFTRGVLIFGPGGTGKTFLVEAVAEKFNIHIVRIETSQIFSKYFGEAEKQLLHYFEKAKSLSPSIILINELDVICPKANGKNDQGKRIIATLSMLMDRLHNTDDQSIMVVATTSKLNDVHKSLRRPGRFGKEIEIHVPNAYQRKEILKIYLENVEHDLKDRDFKEIGDLTHGFVGADLVSLVSKAVMRQYKEKNIDKVSINDFHWALTKVKPSAMREVSMEIPNVEWRDIGGQEELKLKLKQAVEWPFKYQDSFKRLGIIPPRGLLMFGPPGCSKTMIAKALATESKLNFISVKGPELFSKWVGESEKAVREVFRKARQVAPSIVFFDELDAIGGERNMSVGGSSVEERVLAQLLTELDGVEPLGNVTIVGATNRLDRIDPALLRPGRFDRIIYVPLPDAETRRQIFNIQFKKTPVGKEVDLDELVEKTKGYSGAEIIAVCHEAALKAVEEDLAATSVLRHHFLTSLNIILPRTPKSLIKMYDNQERK